MRRVGKEFLGVKRPELQEERGNVHSKPETHHREDEAGFPNRLGPGASRPQAIMLFKGERRTRS